MNVDMQKNDFVVGLTFFDSEHIACCYNER